MSGKTLANGFSDLVVPVCDGGTNDTTTLSLSFDGVDQGAKGTIVDTEAAGALTAWAKVNDATRADTFRLKPTASGYKALPAALTIDGITVQPSIRLEAGDATVSAWTDTLNSNAFAITGTGADPTIDEQSPGIDCKRVKFNAGKYYKAATSSVGALSTNDFVLEFILQYDSSVPGYIINKIDPTLGTADSMILYVSSGNIALYIDSLGGAALNPVLVTGLVQGACYHVMVFFDRSGNVRAYANAVAGTAAAISTLAADNLAVNGKWAVGAHGGNDTIVTLSSVSYFSLWHRASWLATADYAGIAAKRFAQCCGVYAGTAQPLNPGFVDLDFETAGTASWTPAAGAILSKQSGARTGGSGSQILRIQGDGATANGKASQTKVGGITRFTGWARGDGTAVPAIYISGSLGGSWTGTASTTWQYFDVTVKDLTYGGNRVDLFVLGVTSGYVEWDDITIEVDGAIPTAQARTTVAHLEKWNTAGTESYLIPVGAGWMRTDKIKAQDGNFVTGVRVEQAITNSFLYSEDLSNAAWTKTRVTLGTPVVALGVLSFDAIIASADNATHLVAQGVVTTATVSNAVSFYAKKGGANSIKIELNEDATQYAYFNLETGLVGDKGAGFSLSQPAQIYDMGNGYYRCEFRPTTAGITGTVNVYLSNGSTVGSETFAGDASTPSIYLSGAQFEKGLNNTTYPDGVASSYIKTTSATATRIIDSISFHGYENCVSLQSDTRIVRVKYYGSKVGTGYQGYRSLFCAGDNTNNNRALLLRTTVSDNMFVTISKSAALQANFAGDVPAFDGTEKTIELTAVKDYVRLSENRVEASSSDSAADMPDASVINFGAANTNAYSVHGLISDLEISLYGVARPRAILALEKPTHTQSAFIAYDALDDDTYELRAGAGTTRGVTLNGGVLSPAAWHLISLEWSGGTGISLKIDGAEVDTSVADATIAGLTDLLIAWCGLKGYAYEPSAGALSYPITFGAVSIADVQLHSAAPPAAWYTEMIARGVPAKNEHLIHQISQTSHLDATHYDLLTGTAGTKTTEGGASAFVSPTEVGLALGANAVNKTIIDFGSSFAFMAATSHSYDAWIRVDGSGDQCIWANGDENTSDFQALLYDDSTDSLIYKCIIGATVRSVSAAIEIDRLYHVAVTRAYSSGAGTTTLTIYLDAFPIESQVYTGAPVITNDAFVMLSSSEAAGVFTLPFIGATVGNRFYDDALTLAEIEAIYDADSLVMVNGPYATQAVTAATLPATISGAVMPDGAGGYPIVLVQAESGGEWRSIGSAESSAAWSTFEKATPVNAIRLYTKSYNTYAQSASLFDDLDGGTDPGDSTIGLVEVAKNKRKALENLVLMRKPLHSWAVMVVRYV